MAGSVNKVILVGNVGRDPEMRSTNDGRRIANFSIATSETWKDRVSGERKERTEWHRVVVFNENLAEIVEKYVHKGSKLYVEGALQTRKWTDNAGVERYSTEIVLAAYRGSITLLDSVGSSRPPAAESPEEYGRESTRSGPGYSARHDNPAAVGQSRDDLDDEIPFITAAINAEPYLRKHRPIC
jgi:single-strand DNA-binding protein